MSKYKVICINDIIGDGRLARKWNTILNDCCDYKVKSKRGVDYALSGRSAKISIKDNYVRSVVNGIQGKFHVKMHFNPLTGNDKEIVTDFLAKIGQGRKVEWNSIIESLLFPNIEDIGFDCNCKDLSIV